MNIYLFNISCVDLKTWVLATSELSSEISFIVVLTAVLLCNLYTLLRVRIQEHKCHARYSKINLQRSSYKVAFRGHYSKRVKGNCSCRSRTLLSIFNFM